MAFSHGSNDGQKFMGTFTLALGLAGVLPSFRIPVWVIFTCAGWTTHPPNPDHPPVVLHYKHCELFGLAPPLDAFPSDPSQRFSPLGR